MPKPRSMSAPSVARRVVRAAVLLLVLGAVWWGFAPAALGGPASYVITDGTSMLPRFKADGLVITRERSAYHVGEVVAYHNHELKRVVMHRIVAMDGDRYVFKGDNNDFVDQYHATKSDLVGAEWMYWPNGGRYIMKLRQPVAFAVIVGLLTLFAALGFRRTPNRRRRRHHATT